MQKIKMYMDTRNSSCDLCSKFMCVEHPTFLLDLSSPDDASFYEGCYVDWMEWLNRLPTYSPRQFYIADMAAKIKAHIKALTMETHITAATPIDIMFNWKIDINKLWNNEPVLTSILKYVQHLEQIEDKADIIKK